MTSEAQTIADLAVRAAGQASTITTEDGRQYLIVPSSHQFVDVSEPNGVELILPPNIRQSVTLQTVDSLVDYVNIYKGETTVLFADIAQNTIKALIDYHGAGAPDHVAHVASMVLPYSEEWKTWTAISGKLMPQLEFARFLEENAADVAAPSGAELLEACRDLQAVRKVDFKKAVRTSTDNESFEYSDETTATSRKGDIEIPSKFRLNLPVYFGGEYTNLDAFLRWRLDEGNLLLGIALHRAEHVRQAVFKQIVLDAADRTERTAMFGKAN